MSNIEHLLENAICDLERGVPFVEHKSKYPNKEMYSMVFAAPEEIWSLAQYVVYVDRIYERNETMREVEEAYGYPIPGEEK